MHSKHHASSIAVGAALALALLWNPGSAGAPSTVDLVEPGEPGEPLVVAGTVTDASGRPVKGASLHVFQADAAGRYTAEKAMDERNARLAGDIVTGDDGRYEIRTVRPGGYPGEIDTGDGVKRKIPGHIHFEIDAEGHPRRRAQMVFADDPRLTPHWREWARRGRHPVVELERGEDGVLRGTHDWVLEEP